MTRKTAITMFSSIFLVAATATVAMGLPNDYTVTYNMYDDPAQEGIAISGVNYWETGRTMEKCGIAGMTVEELCEYAKTGVR